jgi:hypothetical protein
MVRLELIHVYFMFMLWHDHFIYFVMSFLHVSLKSSMDINRSTLVKASYIMQYCHVLRVKDINFN